MHTSSDINQRNLLTTLAPIARLFLFPRQFMIYFHMLHNVEQKFNDYYYRHD